MLPLISAKEAKKFTLRLAKQESERGNADLKCQVISLEGQRLSPWLFFAIFLA